MRNAHRCPFEKLDLNLTQEGLGSRAKTTPLRESVALPAFAARRPLGCDPFNMLSEGMVMVSRASLDLAGLQKHAGLIRRLTGATWENNCCH